MKNFIIAILVLISVTVSAQSIISRDTLTFDRVTSGWLTPSQGPNIPAMSHNRIILPSTEAIVAISEFDDGAVVYDLYILMEGAMLDYQQYVVLPDNTEPAKLLHSAFQFQEARAFDRQGREMYLRNTGGDETPDECSFFLSPIQRGSANSARYYLLNNAPRYKKL